MSYHKSRLPHQEDDLGRIPQECLSRIGGLLESKHWGHPYGHTQALTGPQSIVSEVLFRQVPEGSFFGGMGY